MIENEKDEKIKNLLENDYNMKAISVDFSDLNNMSLVIRTSFLNSADYIDSQIKKLGSGAYENWFYIAELDSIAQKINICALVNMTICDGYLKIYCIEENRVIKRKKYFNRALDYLMNYVKFKHLKGIKIAPDNIFYDCYLSSYKSNLEERNFKRTEGTLIFEWKNE